MMTLRLFSNIPAQIPQATAWYLADLGEMRGKQDLFTRQSPQKLDILRQHALIESAVSSNRMEGVTVDKSRINALLFGKPVLHDRDEEEIRGYRDALQWIHGSHRRLDPSEKTIRRLHFLSRGNTGDAGSYKTRDSDIIERLPGGGARVRFKTVTAARTPAAMKELADAWNAGLRERWVHPLILIAGWNLDFLCIHPFRDGNGRVSRLLMLLQSYRMGYEAGRYISLERLIETNKERYYESLRQSSQGWHEGKHNPWPYINFVLFILKSAYRELEERAEKLRGPKGAKAELVLDAIRRQAGEFRIVDVAALCPGVSRDWIRAVLAALKKKGQACCRGRGMAARWKYKAK